MARRPTAATPPGDNARDKRYIFSLSPWRSWPSLSPRGGAIHSPAVEDYLKAIWTLQQEDDAASTSRLAEQLGLTAASVTGMVKRLADQRLVSYEPYRGARLTATGERAALRIIRRHRVLELFLQRMLGYEWDRVHAEAERLEHAASDELIERLAELLGSPERDPHGAVIPTAAGKVDQTATPALSDLEPGRRGRVLEVTADEPAQLRYLGSLDLYPGAEVEVTDHAPFDGPISLTVNGTPRILGHALATRIRIAPTAPAARQKR